MLKAKVLLFLFELIATISLVFVISSGLMQCSISFAFLNLILLWRF